MANEDCMFMEVGAVAERLDLSRNRVYEMVRTNEIPHQKFGRYVRFRWSSIERWLDEREKIPAPSNSNSLGGPATLDRMGG